MTWEACPVKKGCICDQRASVWDWTFVDAVFCICLQDRDDRFLESQAVFHSVGLCRSVIYYRPTRPLEAEYRGWLASLKLHESAITLGGYGCWASHRTLAQVGQTAGLKRILVLEDDVEFLPSFSPDTLTRVGKYIGKESTEWDFFHLGYFPFAGRPIDGSNVWKIKGVCTVAYIASVHGMQQLATTEFREPIDMWMLHHATQYAWFPKLAWQRSSPTSITEHWFGYNTTYIKELANDVYRMNLFFFDLLILIVIPLVLTIVFLMLLLFAIRHIFRKR